MGDRFLIFRMRQDRELAPYKVPPSFPAPLALFVYLAHVGHVPGVCVGSENAWEGQVRSCVIEGVSLPRVTYQVWQVALRTLGVLV